jgi:hypothetical protein
MWIKNHKPQLWNRSNKSTAMQVAALEYINKTEFQSCDL